jgi:toxin-antitoxin system PIN domain toxin
MVRLADSNIWLALALSKHTFHPAVRGWFARQKPPTAVLFCRSTQQSFLRLVTTAAVLAPYGIPPLSNQAAWAAYDGFLADDRIAWVEEPRGLDRQWKKLAGITTPSPKLWMDGYLAAFALAGGYQLVTTDKAFKQFKGLDVLVLPRG